ncbi:2'-5' RNA ligase family protein [Piscinibacter terrae]|uniref:2'-5' RNA ligase family protein n=1 Tax=Piscinibacter terrae TaxID=2496871 RepID=A0A3N7JK25_9BURK|nr:2'-5' RNA ligase family protein [Albitalea terrae]RQP21679.1 hypothetical protein DZC73_27655 [Albitalea terrae]
MKQLYTLAFPVLSRDDTQWIEAFRREHDPHCGLVDAHFTMVFGCSEVAEETYLAHLQALSRSSRAVRFTCRYAMLGADDEVERAYVFLVPDEGYSGLSRLHDELYKGPLAEHLRLDIPFVPHITIGASGDRMAAKRLCDDLNGRELSIAGTVSALTVAALEERRLRHLKTFELVPG